VKRFWAILLLSLCLRCPAAEVIPPAPKQYFNDYAHVVSPGIAASLNQKLEDFERESSDQIIVAIFPKMQSDSSIDDYTVRVARSWKVGLTNKNNGAVLFVFIQEHKMFIQVGYGLEGVLPDALCKRIIDEQISPRFKAGDFNGGLSAGVQAIIAATKGEYKGNGTTVADNRGNAGSMSPVIWLIVFLALAFLIGIRSAKRAGASGWLLTGGGWGGWGGGGSSGGGGFSGGGGGGGFSGGGGSFGGGGAGGSW
jgi:uncharacterized protein